MPFLAFAESPLNVSFAEAGVVFPSGRAERYMHLGAAPDDIVLTIENMGHYDHFKKVVDWSAAARLVDFEPRQPAFTAGFDIVSLAVFVMDHRKRRLSIGARSLEARYGAFVIDQKRLASATDARRQALSTPYGAVAKTVRGAGFEGRGYALGPVPDLDDIDGRSPAIIVWSDGAMLYLVASDQIDEVILLRVASSMYDASE